MEGRFCIVLFLGVFLTTSLTSPSTPIISTSTTTTADHRASVALATTAVHLDSVSGTDPVPTVSPNISINPLSATGTTESSLPFTVPRTTLTVDPQTNQTTTTLNPTIAEGQTADEHSSTLVTSEMVETATPLLKTQSDPPTTETQSYPPTTETQSDPPTTANISTTTTAKTPWPTPESDTPNTTPSTSNSPITTGPLTTRPITTTSSTSTPITNTTSTTTTTSTAPTTTTPINTTTRTTPATTRPITTTTPNNTSPNTTITPSTTATTPTAAPRNCTNGQNVNGVCICPDEWTGETCSVINFCNGTTLNGFRFPNTAIGWFAYSAEKCPGGGGTPRATTRCSSREGRPEFDLPRRFDCGQTLQDIQRNLSSAADLETLASSAQVLTSRPESLKAEDIIVAADIANRLLLSPNATESVRVAAVATVSQLLNATESNEMEESSTTQGLTVTLDQLALNLSLTSNTSQVVQPNLVVQSAQVPASDTQGVQFTALAGLSGSFVSNRIQLNTNVSKVTEDSGLIDALVHIQFPSGGRQQRSNTSLGFVLYQNSRFFPSSIYRRKEASVRVLSASVRGLERRVVPQSVEMHFRLALPENTFLHDFACVSWDYNLRDWSTQGCSKGNASDNVLRCLCNHTTNFAALWSFRKNYKYAEALGVISTVGLSFSLLGLVVTIIHHLKENLQMISRNQQSRLNSKLSLFCIYLSLLAFIITFLSGVQNPSPQNSSENKPSFQNQIMDSDLHVEPDRGHCTPVAALLHFFLLATFSWNSVYGTQLVLLVRSMQRHLPPYWTPLSIGVGWGVPALVMAVTLAATYRVQNPLDYRQEEFCWLAALDQDKHFSFHKPMFWAFLLPLGLVLIYNTVLLVLTSLTTCRVDPRITSTKRSSLTRKVLVSFSLAVLLGLSWTLGYFVLVTTGTLHLVFSILFCLGTTTQGLQIFLLFTARTRSFQASMRRSVRCISSARIPFNSTKYDLRKKWNESSTSETYRDILHQDTSI